METGITKHVDGTFSVRVATNVKGKFFQRFKRNISTVGEARRVRLQFIEDRAVWKNHLQNDARTWKQAVEEYLVSAEETLSPSTFQNERFSLNAHTVEWQEMYLEEFNRDFITSHLNRVMDGKNAVTKNNVTKFIRKVFALQLENGRIPFNPAAKIRFIKVGLKNNKLTCMTKAETAFLLQQSYRLNHPWHEIYRVTYQLGLRSGEAFALPWKNIDFENDLVHITQSYCFKSEKFGPPKNREPRTIPMNSGLAAFLKELKLKSGSEELVLPHPPGWKHGDAAKILKSFQTDIGIQQTNFHSLRASFITHLLLDGMAITKVQHMVGHKDLATTQRYVRLTASDLKGATDSIDLRIQAESRQLKMS